MTVRISFLVATLFFVRVAQAEPQEPHRKKRPISLGPVEVNGRRQAPVGVVIPRDPSVKDALDRLGDEHLRDAAERR